MRAWPQTQVQTQGRRRRFAQVSSGAKNEHRPRVARGTDLQAPQSRRRHLRQPAQHGGEAAGLQGLLGRPQALLRRVGVHPDQALWRHPLPTQRRHVGHKRRGDEQDVPTAPHDLAQNRGEQAPFSLTGLCLQHLGQGLAGPAPTRQLGVQLRVPAGEHPSRPGAQGVPPPDRLGQMGGQERGAVRHHDTVWIYSIISVQTSGVQLTMTPLQAGGCGLFLPSPVHPPGFWQNETP